MNGIIKRINCPILKDKHPHKCMLNVVRRCTESNFIDIDKDHLSVLFEEAKTFERIPVLESISLHHWLEINKLSSKTARKKYYEYLWLTEVRRHKRQEKNEEKEASTPVVPETRSYLSNILHGHKVKQYYNHKLLQATMFGQKIVIDCSYDSEMSQRECATTANQINRIFASNRQHADPFDICLCNVSPAKSVMTRLKMINPSIYDNDFPIAFHEESYLDVFWENKGKLVYLTPDSNEDLEFNHKDIYIIGALTDRIRYSTYSLDKAKAQNIRSAKLPLENILNKGGQDRALAINQVFDILLDFKYLGGDIETAIKRHVAARKLKEVTEVQSLSDPLRDFWEHRRQTELWPPNKLVKYFKKRNMHKHKHKGLWMIDLPE